MDITTKTKLLGLFGVSIEHSKSPIMYNYCFEKYGMDYCYMAFDMDKKDVGEIVSSMKSLGMIGANITMPFKNDIIDYLDKLSPVAEIVGAVNTIVNKEGILFGYNTDGLGFIRNLKSKGIDVKDKKITILGAGGVATAIQVQSALDGVREISIFNRKDKFFERARKTTEKFELIAPEIEANIYDIEDLDRLKKEVSSSDIFINATSLGMHGENDSPFYKGLFREDLVVADVVYDPLETMFLKTAKDEGCKYIINGGGLLLHQGAAAFKLYTGEEMPVKEIEKLYFNKER